MATARTATTPQLMTADEFYALGDTARCELIEGKVTHLSPTNFEHGRIAGALHVAIGLYARDRRSGIVLSAETGFTLRRNPDTVRAPDIAFVRAERVPPPGEQRRYVERAPDLVVEVVSPSQNEEDMFPKVVAYLEAGVVLVWVVYPEWRRVVTYNRDNVGRILTDRDELTGDDVLPDFNWLISCDVLSAC